MTDDAIPTGNGEEDKQGKDKSLKTVDVGSDTLPKKTLWQPWLMSEGDMSDSTEGMQKKGKKLTTDDVTYDDKTKSKQRKEKQSMTEHAEGVLPSH